MDDPNNLMIITGIMIFAAPLDVERFKATINKSLLRFKRFGQRVVPSRVPPTRLFWEDDPEFDIDNHIQRVILPSPGDQGVFQELISELMSHELEYSRPLWQFYVLEQFGQGSALICRLHHAIADGISLMHVLLSLADEDPDAPWPTYQPGDIAHFEKTASKTGVRHKRLSLENTARFAQSVREAGSRIRSNPSTARQYVRLGASTAVSAARIVLRWPDPETVYKGPIGYKKQAAWSDPLPLDEVKNIGKAYGGTVNDVLLSMVTGALRRYIQYRGEKIDRGDIRGFIPVNLRPVKLDDELGNQFGLLFLKLPLSTADPVQRLHKLKFHMDNLKSSTEALAAFGILNLFGVLPNWLQEVGVSIFDTKGSAVMTNVPGPQKQLYLAGAPIDMVMAWVPQSGRVSTGISIISYNGKVWLGVATDQGLVPDPERIIQFFNQEFDELKLMAEKQLAKRSEKIQPMLSMLDNALKSLDDILE
jgi:WS/DGAT/MGAT family acyltransferase